VRYAALVPGCSLPVSVAHDFKVAKTAQSDMPWLHGVVGYHMCLTHTRSPDRAWVKSLDAFLFWLQFMDWAQVFSGLSSFVFIFIDGPEVTLTMQCRPYSRTSIPCPPHHKERHVLPICKWLEFVWT
jgi:hypothetical protein